ncbi:MAG: UDP-N-acetylmuramoyl-L-alanyl-D-glutamate--2,6-diaminopimelate ligase [Aquificota bacterium]|nr:MAG: UDP-N-acetylmuramoyl-L-alanyl-D-glutamate--2,6-diaminopimelate ligase [Aquificota bacterium]
MDFDRIKGITNNSKDVKKDYIFIAIKGTKTDGHIFVEEAIKKGASVVVLQNKRLSEEIRKKYPDVHVILSENTRKFQAVLSKEFYKKPDESLKIIGVTGTNGKTTTANLIHQYLSLYRKNAGIIGTIEYRYKDTVYASGRTTPDSIEWFRILNDMKSKGAEYVVSEISSHSIDQYRVYGTRFEGGIFTNLTQEHLDYHGSMENYFQAKKGFFDLIYEKNIDGIAVINTDDEYGKKLYSLFKNRLRVVSYGKKDSDFKIEDADISLEGTAFSLKHKEKTFRLKSKLLGEFNIYNIAAAFAFLYTAGVDERFLISATEELEPIKGRFETVYSGKFLVINDYAHTPDALKNILSSLKKIKHNRLITVFGAGGDRDKEKRPLMGKVAEKYADIVILTSDNPRSEEPEDIVKDIKNGMEKEPKIILDRKEAIGEAINMAKEGGIVLIAGKGHENYQIVKDKIIPFDDTSVAKHFIKEKNLL